MTNIPTSCDVVVIGGGPSGSTVSNLLSRQGYNVVLLEKSRHPRHKVGENLIPDFWKYCDMLGVTEDIEAAGFVVKGGALANWRGQHHEMFFSDFGYDRPALHVERDRFDEILLRGAERVGTHVFEEIAVTGVTFLESVESDNGDLTSTTATVHYRSTVENHRSQIECRYVVDASGQGAVLGRQLGLREIDADFRYMALWGYYVGNWYIDTEVRVQPYSNIRTAPPVTYVTSIEAMEDFGWTWFMPLQEQISVGLVMPREYVKTLRKEGEPLADFLQRQVRQIPVVGELLADGRYVPESHGVIQNYSYQSKEFAGPGYMMIGDAAGFVDPIFSVGVVLGMYTGASAAWAVDECIRHPHKARRIEQVFSRQVRARLELSRSLALPRYQGEANDNDLANEVIQFSQAGTRELINTAAHLTDRSDNYKGLHRDFRHAPSQDKLLPIDQIDLSPIYQARSENEFVVADH